MRYILFIVLFFLWAMYMIASASTIEIDVLPCSSDAFSGIIGPSLSVTEVWFDGTDERIEIMNMWNEAYSGEATIVWVKTTPLTIPLYVNAHEMVLIWDAMADTPPSQYAIRGQGFSISDSTWFTIKLLLWGAEVYSYDFEKSFVASQPNLSSIAAVWSWMVQQRDMTPDSHATIANYPYRATPGYVFCASTPLESVEDVPVEDEPSLEEIEEPGEEIEEEPVVEEEDPPIVQPLPILAPVPLSCQLTEVYSQNDEFPEYVELYCPTWFSGDIMLQWLWVSSASKVLYWPLASWFTIVTSSSTGFLYTWNVRIVEWISLRDDWEAISLFSTWYITALYTFPAHPSTQSFYPLCGATGCFVSPSPGFPHEYYQRFALPAPVCVATNQTASTAAQPTSTPSAKESYYMWLYEKRKATATGHAKTISTLKADQKKTTSTITALQKKIATLEAQLSKAKATTVPKSASSKTTTSKSLSAPKTTTTTSTAPKAWTISKSSKGYIKLVDEHTFYKWYIDYLHAFLKSHLYTQYKTLWIESMQKNFAKWLAAIRQQKYTMEVGSWQNISSFESYVVQGSWGNDLTGYNPNKSPITMKIIYKKYTLMANDLKPIISTLSSISHWLYAIIWLQNTRQTLVWAYEKTDNKMIP
jgi:hypothetical protein